MAALAVLAALSPWLFGAPGAAAPAPPAPVPAPVPAPAPAPMPAPAPVPGSEPVPVPVPVPDPGDDDSDDSDDPTPPPPDPATLAAAQDKLAEDNATLRDDVLALREDVDALQAQVASLSALKGRVSGYLDVGAFWVGGDGTGFILDNRGTIYPQYSYAAPWVFLGDPLATAINSRGEPASTGASRAVMQDAIDQAGPTAIVNSAALDLYAGINDRLSVTTFIDFLPRGRQVSDPNGLFLGDYLDIKLAFAEWQPHVKGVALALQAGKFDSVVGYEYRVQEAPDRTTVTPSLLCRYVCGHPTGVKARAQFLDKALIVNTAITTGSNFTESFGFADETDANQRPTGSIRVSYQLRGAGHEVELGLSGAYGPQDQQPDADVRQWHTGIDLHGAVKDLEFAAEAVWGAARGKTDTGPDARTCDLAPCLHYKAAYGLVAWRASNTFIPYARVDWRDALHQAGASFVYVSKLARATVGLRAELGEAVIVKAEYTLNRELGAAPQFPDDIFTSSLVVKF
ncbi:MAG: porin [Deltaproteobacteria bacterium]|nr:porin [Deltaproteobacteria bacterium]